jgi:ATP-dependent DNA helicase RecG
VEPITLEQLQSFNAPMLSRNPVLHYVFARMGMAEERGLGLKSMRSGAENAGLPLPKYTWENPYLVLTLLRSREAAVSALPPSVFAALTDSEREGWKWLATRTRVTAGQYVAGMRVSERTARRHLSLFVELGLVRKVGGGPSTEYEVV